MKIGEIKDLGDHAFTYLKHTTRPAFDNTKPVLYKNRFGKVSQGVIRHTGMTYNIGDWSFPIKDYLELNVPIPYIQDSTRKVKVSLDKLISNLSPSLERNLLSYRDTCQGDITGIYFSTEFEGSTVRFVSPFNMPAGLYKTDTYTIVGSDVVKHEIEIVGFDDAYAMTDNEPFNYVGPKLSSLHNDFVNILGDYFISKEMGL